MSSTLTRGHREGGPKFFVNFAQTCDEQMLKISRQYLDLRKSYDHLTENLAQQMAYFQ